MRVILDPETGVSRPIVGPEGFFDVVLSPDSTIAYFNYVTSESHIWLMEIEEGGR